MTQRRKRFFAFFPAANAAAERSSNACNCNDQVICFCAHMLGRAAERARTTRMNAQNLPRWWQNVHERSVRRGRSVSHVQATNVYLAIHVFVAPVVVHAAIVVRSVAVPTSSRAREVSYSKISRATMSRMLLSPRTRRSAGVQRVNHPEVSGRRVQVESQRLHRRCVNTVRAQWNKGNGMRITTISNQHRLGTFHLAGGR